MSTTKIPASVKRNIAALKKIGKANAKAKAATAKANRKAHLAAMAQRSKDAALVRAQRAADGLARSAANAQSLHQQAVARRAQNDNGKAAKAA